MSGYRDFSYSDLAGDIATNGADAFRNAANAAGSLVCTLNQNFSRWMIGAGDPFGTGAVAAGLYDQLCRPRGQPTPVPPAPPVSGGQCPVPYNIVSHMRQPDGSIATDSAGSTVGPLTQISVTRGGKLSTGGPNGEFIQGVTFRFNPGGGTSFTEVSRSAVGNNDNQEPTGFYTLERQDGQPDNCGSITPQYPDVQPSPGDLNINVPINITPDITVNAPVVITRPPSPPDINVNVGPFNVSFDLGGVHVRLDPNISFPQRPDPRPNPPPNSSKPSPDEPGATCDLSDIETKLNELLDCDRCDQQKNYKSLVFNVAESGTLALPSRCYAVAIELTERPASEKIQFGNDGPDVIYAGWGWFGRAPYYERREPIDADGKLFVWKRDDIFPDTFAYTLYGGYKGRVRALYYDLPQG